VFENTVQRRIFGPNERKNRKMEKNCIMNSSVTCSLHEILGSLRRMKWVWCMRDEKCIPNFDHEAWREGIT
jgi:hypothetical protein